MFVSVVLQVAPQVADVIGGTILGILHDGLPLYLGSGYRLIVANPSGYPHAPLASLGFDL
jgi:hypothetical protein